MRRDSRYPLILAGVLLLFPAQLHSQAEPRPNREAHPRTLHPRTQQPPLRAPAPPRPARAPAGRPLTISQVEGQGANHDRFTDRNVRRQRTAFGRSLTASPESWEDWDRFLGKQWGPGADPRAAGASYVYTSPRSLALVSIENGLWIRESEGSLGTSPVHVTTADPPLEAHFAVQGAPGMSYGVEVALFGTDRTSRAANSDLDSAVQRAFFDSQLDGQTNSHSLLLHLSDLEPGEYILSVQAQDIGRNAVSLPATATFIVSAPDGAGALQ